MSQKLHTKAITGVTMLFNDAQAASTGEDGVVAIWNLKGNNPL